MIGYLIGTFLCICAILDRRHGSALSADIESSAAAICFVLQAGFNRIAEPRP